MWPLSILRRMAARLQKNILNGLLTIMLPISRFLLRSGIGYKEFSRVCKSAFVQVATDDYGIRGRPTNISRVAVMTGLTRKEVKKIRNYRLGSADDLWGANLSPPTQTLNHWHADADFCDKEGKPLELPFSGGFPSFTDLVRRYAGDIPPGAMRTELKRSGAVIESEGGKLRALSAVYIPYELDSDFINGWAFSLANLATTLTYNSSLRSTENEEERRLQARPERYVWATKLRKTDVDAFKIMAVSKTEELLTQLNEWIINHESDAVLRRADSGEKTEPARVGLGIYYFED